VLHSKRSDDTDDVAMVHTSQHLFLAKGPIDSSFVLRFTGAPGFLVAGCWLLLDAGVVFQPSLYHDLARFRITQASTNRWSKGTDELGEVKFNKAVAVSRCILE
jgi:hypothetical protein